MDSIININKQEILLESLDLPNESCAIQYPRTIKSIKDPVTYLLDCKEYDNVNVGSKIKKEIKLSKSLYKYEGIIGSAIDALVELSITKISLQHTGEGKLDEILNHFISNVNNNSINTSGIDELSQEITLEYYLSGNVFPFEYWADISDGDVSYFAPSFIYLLNPENVGIVTDDASISGYKLTYIKNSDSMKLLNTSGRTDKRAAILKRSLKGTELQKLKQHKHMSGDFELNQNIITHFKRKSLSYDLWGVPYLSKVFSLIADLNRLRMLDQSTLEGLINLITIFKIGTEEKPANRARLLAFANLLTNPKSNTSLVWGHDVDIKQVGPEGKLLNIGNKYSQKYEEIFAGLGLPPVLFGLNKAGNADSYNQMLVLVSRMEHWRNSLKNYYEKLLYKISKINGYPKIKPKLIFNDIGLNKDIYFSKFILTMYDRGLLDPQMVMEKADFDFESVVTRFEEFKKGKYQDKLGIGLPPKLPYTGGIDNKQKSPQDPNVPIKRQPDITKPTVNKNVAKAILKKELSQNIEQVFENNTGELSELKLQESVSKINDMAMAFNETYFNINMEEFLSKMKSSCKTIADNYNHSDNEFEESSKIYKFFDSAIDLL